VPPETFVYGRKSARVEKPSAIPSIAQFADQPNSEIKHRFAGDSTDATVTGQQARSLPAVGPLDRRHDKISATTKSGYQSGRYVTDMAQSTRGKCGRSESFRISERSVESSPPTL